MDNTTWAFGPDGPQWPVDGSGQKEKAVRLMNSFDSAADSVENDLLQHIVRDECTL